MLDAGRACREYSDRDELGVFAIDSTLIYVPAALSCTDLILNGP